MNQRLAAALADRYRIERELGQGGMATVYLAQDLRHDRRVALKVLRPELAAILGAERFLAEIKTTANLQHPHILPLHDSGQVESTVFYVMPFVAGESLRDRLSREKQLPVDEAVRIAIQVASALDYAHRQGVVHRDIKPENILLHDGSALVADFGIALAASSTGATRMTETGMSLGTPAYMSPEQAMGERAITARSDVYALGVVSYEMLAGDPPFTGSTAQSIVAKVMTEEPRPLTLQRKTIPPNVEAAVLTALQKLPADRFASAAQFAAALGDPAYASRTAIGAATPIGRPANRPIALFVATTLILAALAAWGWWRPAGRGGEEQVVASSITLPDSAPVAFVGTAPFAMGRTALALSPDGTTLAYVAQRGTRTQIYLRPMDRDTVFPVPGTEDACCLLFSPDGAWLAFLARDQLSKVRLGFAGAPIPILTVNSFYGADWGEDGVIIVSDLQGRHVVRVNAETGAREESDFVMGGPRVLPGGRAIISQVGWKSSTAMASLILPEGNEQRALPVTGTDLRYAPTGHLTYAHQGALWAVPFDLSSLRVTGEPLAVLPRLRTEAVMGNAQYTFAQTGLLVYAQGGSGNLARLVALHRSGRIDTLPFEPAVFGCFSLSPDGRRIAARVADPATGLWNSWVYDLAGGSPLRLTTSGDANCPSWSPDGRVTSFIASGGETRVFTQSPSGRESPVTRATLAISAGASAAKWSPDGKWIVFNTVPETRATDVVAAELDGGTVHTVAGTAALEWGGVFSPDGHWLAYSSSESGQDEIYVQPWPVTGQRWRLSRNGGEEALWSNGGRELIYRLGQEWWAVRIISTAPFTAGEPERIARGPYLNVSGVEYAVSPDGDRLYLLEPASGPATSTSLTVISNWFSVLRELSRRASRE